MPIPARRAWIAYESIRLRKKGLVPIGTLRIYRQNNPRINAFNQVWLASGPRQGDDRFALLNILAMFRHLTVFEGVPPELVDAKFMKIAEYADHLREDYLAGTGHD